MLFFQYNIKHQDNEDPVITNVPQNMIINATRNKAEATWTEPDASDNSGMYTLSSNYAPGSSFALGRTSVIYTAIDPSRNTAMAAFMITVQDVEGPQCTDVPGPIVTDTDPGQSTASVSWIPPTIIDNSGDLTVTSNYSPGNLFPIGLTEVIYTATDASGIDTMCSFNIEVKDTEDPVISGIPMDMIVATTDNEKVVTWSPPSATDNSEMVTLSTTHESGFSFPIDITTVMYTAIDPSGNTVTTSFTVTVQDAEGPQCSDVPQTITQDTDPGEAIATVTWVLPNIQDNSGLLTVTSNYKPGDSFPIGVTVVVYEAIDFSGITTMCGFNIEIKDNEDPQISNLSNDIQITTGLMEVEVTWSEPIVTDNGGQVTVTSSHTSGSLFPLGNTFVTYTAIDSSGNIATDMFTITVQDDESPQCSNIPDDIIQDTDLRQSTSAVSWMPPTISDNSGSVNVTSNYEPGDSFPIGVTRIIYEAIDSSRLSTMCFFLITVTDNEEPVFSELSGVKELFTDRGLPTGELMLQDPEVTDNAGLVTVTSDFPPIHKFSIGETIVTFTAVDMYGNRATATLTVTVIDNEIPTFLNAVSKVIGFANSSQTQVPVTWNNPTASDNSGSVSVTQDRNPGDMYQVGETTVTYTAVDPSDNTATHSVTIAVTAGTGFSNVPEVITANTDPGLPTATVNWTEPTINQAGQFTLTSTHQPGDSFPVGDTMVTYRATRSTRAVVEEASFTVSVTDNESPVLQGAPGDIETCTAPGQPTAVGTWTEPTVTDNTGTVTFTSNYSPGSSFVIGTTVVTYTAKDQYDNVITHSFVVIVKDKEKPVIVNPANAIVANTMGESTAPIYWPEDEVTITDNSGSYSISSVYDFPEPFRIGEAVVVFTATDPSGNFDIGSFIARVEDHEPPYFMDAPPDIMRTADDDRPSAIITWNAPTVYDNSGWVVSQNQSHISGSRFPTGRTEVTYSATDPYGNIGTHSFIITIYDDEVPRCRNAPGSIIRDITIQQSPSAVSWMPPTITDNSGSVTVMSNYEPGDTFPVGDTTVTYEATDPAGHVTTCSFVVTIRVVFANPPDDITRNTDPGQPTASVTWTTPTTLPSYTLSSNYNSGHTFQIGSTVVMYTSRSQTGETANYSFSITVIDNENPMMSNLPAARSVNSDTCDTTTTGTCLLTWNDPTVTDNSGVVTLSSNYPPGSSFPIGDTDVKFTATDPSNNRASAFFVVTVIDNQPPTISGIPNNKTRPTDPGQSFAVVSWDQPIVADNSGSYNVGSEPRSGSRFPIGQTKVLFSANDQSENTARSSFFITVIDEEPPVFIDLPSDIYFPPTYGITDREVSWTTPSARDNSGGHVELTSDYVAGSIFPVGVSTVTYTAVDPFMNQATASFTINIPEGPSPTSPPVLSNLPDNIRQNTDPGQATASVTWIPPTALPSYTLSSNLRPGDQFAIGMDVVVYTATGPGGSATHLFTVTIVDNEKPTISNTPDAIHVDCDCERLTTDSCTATWQNPTVTDNSGMVTLTSNYPSGYTFPAGDTTVTLTAIDESNNRVITSFVVTVTIEVLCNLPGDIIQSTDPGERSATVTWPPPTVVPPYTAVPNRYPGSLFPIGVTTVTYTARSLTGVTVTHSFNVTVIDDERPIIDYVPIDMTVYSSTCDTITPNTCVVTWFDPSFTDNSGIVTWMSNYPSGYSFPIGDINVTFTATDPSQNVATASFVVTVKGPMVTPTSPPVFSNLPGDIRQQTDPGQPTASVFWRPPNVLPSYTLTSNYNPGRKFPIGITDVFYTAINELGENATYSFTVTAIDNEEPRFSKLPNDTSVDIQTCETKTVGICLVRWTDPTVTDNSGTMTSLTSNYKSGHGFPIGVTVVTFTAIDPSGNSANALFVVTVIGMSPSATERPSTSISTTPMTSTVSTTTHGTPLKPVVPRLPIIVPIHKAVPAVIVGLLTAIALIGLCGVIYYAIKDNPAMDRSGEYTPKLGLPTSTSEPVMTDAVLKEDNNDNGSPYVYPEMTKLTRGGENQPPPRIYSNRERRPTGSEPRDFTAPRGSVKDEGVINPSYAQEGKTSRIWQKRQGFESLQMQQSGSPKMKSKPQNQSQLSNYEKYHMRGRVLSIDESIQDIAVRMEPMGTVAEENGEHATMPEFVQKIFHQPNSDNDSKKPNPEEQIELNMNGAQNHKK